MSSSLLHQHLYTISDIKLLNPPSKIFKRIVRIEISPSKMSKSVAGIINKDLNHVAWNEKVALDITPESTVVLRIYKKKSNRKTKVFAEHATKLSSLLDMRGPSGICEIGLGEKGQLRFSINVQERLGEAIEHIADIHLNEGEAWTKFLAYFQTVKMAADPVTGLNAHAHQAWSILAAIPNIIQTHFTQNSNINKLLQRLMDIYTYIADASRLPVLTNTQRDKLKLLIDQTCDCAYRIKEFTENSTAEKILKGPGFNVEILQFKELFDGLFDTIQRHLILETTIMAKKIEGSTLLSELPYAENAGFVDGKKCLPGTREKLINEILAWVDTKDAPNRVLVLSGQAGMGKSAVAHTIAEICRTQNRLGSFFCFSRSDQDRRNLLFSTISRELADGDVLWRQNLLHAIEPIAIRKSLDPVTQFNELIVKPSQDMKTTGLIVIIIDALDESGNRTERGTLLNLLFGRTSKLPKNYRIIITSRPEPDIEGWYQHPNVFCKHMAGTDPNDTLHDIQNFIFHKLSPVANTLDAKLGPDWHSQLAIKAQGLFQWANLACLYINPTVNIGLVKRSKAIISKQSSSSSLYELYHQLLDDLPEFQVEGFLAMFQTVIGAIIVSRRPLSISTLQALFGPDIEDATVRDVLQPFQPLLIGIHDSTTHIRPLHTSLFDFFISAEQKPGTPNRYYIDTSDQSSFTYACLRIMNRMLQFNICDLETSHLRNRDVPNFISQVAKAVPLQLSYACCFWAYHLEYSQLNPELLNEICDLMHNKLLYLFEALGLLGEIEHGRAGMQILKYKTKDEHSELAARAAEASQFAFEFGEIITESTPHLYLSALPYISNHSFISRQFIPQYPQLLSIDVGQPLDLRPKIKDSVVHKHPSAYPCKIAFSPQHRQIAAGFSNGDFWVWDYVTGEMICQSSPKAKTFVHSVVFSSDGERVYCCFKNGSILTWEAKTKKVVYEEHTEGLCGDCTISSDGRYIASMHLSGDSKTLAHVCLYDRKTGSKLLEETCKYDTRIMFSSCGRLFAFQSQDRAIRLWDMQTHMFVSLDASITGRTLVALTDNYMVASMEPLSKGDGIREAVLWDIQSNRRVRRFSPESESGSEYAFSTNGTYLLRSEGKKHSIWNAVTGEITQRSVQGSGRATSGSVAAISPDSKYIAFSEAGTMHVLAWDDLVQGQTEDLREGDGAQEVESSDGHVLEVWLKGRYLLLYLSFSQGNSRKSLQVLDTTRRPGHTLDFQIDFDNLSPLIRISPEDDHWSIAYVDQAKSRPRVLRLWNIDQKQEVILDRRAGDVTALAFSATGDCLIKGDREGNIKIWDVRTRQLISISGGRVSDWITALAFSMTGTTFFVAYGAEDVIEERECSESQCRLNGPFRHHSPVESVFDTSNNTHICVISYSTDDNGRVSLYHTNILDRTTGESIQCFNTPQSPKFSPNQRYIAWIHKEDQKKVAVWDLEKGLALHGLPSGNAVTIFEFSSDSKRISMLNANEVHIWDIELAKLVMRLPSNSFSFKEDWHLVKSYKDRLLSVDRSNEIWDLYVHGIMTRLHGDHLNNSRFGTLPRPYDCSEIGQSTSQLIEGYNATIGNSDALRYALVAWDRASFSPWAKLDEDGWMLGPHRELLFWVPKKMREGLWYPSMMHMLPEEFTRLNFDKFVHGEQWIECGTPPEP